MYSLVVKKQYYGENKSTQGISKKFKKKLEVDGEVIDGIVLQE